MRTLTNCKMRTIRKERGLPQWKIAYFANVSPSRLSMVENGLPPRPDEKERIANVLKASVKTIWPK